MLAQVSTNSVSSRPSRRAGRRVARHPQFHAERLEQRAMCNVDDGTPTVESPISPPAAPAAQAQTVINVPGQKPIVVEHPSGTQVVVVVVPSAPAPQPRGWRNWENWEIGPIPAGDLFKILWDFDNASFPRPSYEGPPQGAPLPPAGKQLPTLPPVNPEKWFQPADSNPGIIEKRLQQGDRG